MPTDNNNTKIANLIDEFIPLWKHKKAFIWPPDVFAVTSVILRRTGCYRAMITDATVDRADVKIYSRAQKWIKWIADCLLNDSVTIPSDIRSLVQLRMELYELGKDLTFEQLRAYSDEDQGDNYPKVREFVKKLIELHALADEACSGFGVLIEPFAETGIAHALANLLLVASGSLATLPKRYGFVLPKFRTPTDGLTMRSFSRHVTHHISEVEIFWRAIPWTSGGGSNLNILIAPYPCHEIKDTWFNKVDEKFHVSRYFRYGPPPSEEEDENDKAGNYLRQIVEIIKQQDSIDACVDMVVFPELSLTTKRYNFFLWLLEDAKLKHIPVVMGGVRSKGKKGEDLNMVTVSSYLADYWYQATQRKHHRWKLNGAQLRQYELVDKFADDRDWIEHIGIGQRRLTILAPTRRLALCTLICEDLARLEPVSEIIRGVGPNLLIALLLDGPQLVERWPARYASVFADDPGTAVLSVTAMGMVSRSKPLSNMTENINKQPDVNKHPVIALWKDQKFGSKQLGLDPNKQAVLLTLGSSPTQDFTADGRGGDGQSYVLFHSQHKELPKTIIKDQSEPPEMNVGTEVKKNIHKNWEDMRELAVLTYLIDACSLLGLSCEFGRKLHDEAGNWTENRKKWIDRIMGLLEGDADASDYNTDSIQKVIKVVRKNLADPRGAGLATGHKKQEAWHTKGLSKAVEMSKKWIKDLNANKPANQILNFARRDFAGAANLEDEEKEIITVRANDPNIIDAGISTKEVADAYVLMKKRRVKLVAISILTSLKASLEHAGHHRDPLPRGNKHHVSPRKQSTDYKTDLADVKDALNEVKEFVIDVEAIDKVFPSSQSAY